MGESEHEGFGKSEKSIEQSENLVRKVRTKERNKERTSKDYKKSNKVILKKEGK